MRRDVRYGRFRTQGTKIQKIPKYLLGVALPVQSLAGAFDQYLIAEDFGAVTLHYTNSYRAHYLLLSVDVKFGLSLRARFDAEAGETNKQTRRLYKLLVKLQLSP
jgi:hypothetical protein